MKVIRRNKMPNGTDIQQEDWSMNYDCFSPKSTIAVYPVSMKACKEKNIINGEKFRLALQFDSEEQANNCYDSLSEGTSKISDYKEFGAGYGNTILFNLIGE